MHWYLYPYKTMFNLFGRISRANFWQFVIASYIITMTAGFVDILIMANPLSVPPVIGSFVFTMTSLPMISLCVRRYHDVGFSGWWLLVPGANIALLVAPGKAGDNKYGPVVELEGFMMEDHGPNLI